MKKSLFFLALLLCFLQANAQQTVGVFTRTNEAEDGYVLFAPMVSDTTYLIDKCGDLIHTWKANLFPGAAAYFLPDGTLLRAASVGNTIFNVGGNGGRLTRFSWNSNNLWSYVISNDTECQHHDMCYMPNGHILTIVWQYKTPAQMLQAGRDPNNSTNNLWPEKIVELVPVGNNDATIAWEWNVWDHLVQHYDASKDNYGVIANHPELVDVNLFPMAQASSGDWLHANSIDYNPQLDEIVISIHNISEIWVIDHSTTTAEAATHSGGLRNKGGDLLYRWGNPQNYGAGTAADQQFFLQHNAHWIQPGLPDSGKLMVFNNGDARPGGNYSSVDILNTPVDGAGNYTLVTGQAYGPAAPEWSYVAPNPTDFFAQNISGAQRMSNGNTLICSGPQGEFFEIDSAKNIIWKYISPVTLNGIVSQGTVPTTNPVFRSPQYAPDYAGFTGLTLTPGAPIEHNPLPSVCGLNVRPVTSRSGTITAVNPFDSKITLQAWQDIPQAGIYLTDVTGRTIQQWHNQNLVSGQAVSLDVNGQLPAGVYMLQVKNAGSISALKLVKE
jgi:hypothetical protein